MIQIVAIFFGGGLGSLARYGVSEMANLFFSNSLKVTIFATLLANILACLILGYFVGKDIQPKYIIFWSVGFCGGFSTFSTFSNEVLQLIKLGQYALVFAYIVFSVTLGLVAFILGSKIF